MPRMDAKTLYIIGNGFDLHHGLPTRYSDFKAYLEVVDHETHDWVQSYIPAGGNWANLEQALAELDIDSIVSDMSCFLGSYADDEWSDAGHHDFQYEVDRVAEGLSKTLQGRFADWVRSIKIPHRSNFSGLLQTLDANATFLTFNYTSTLTQLYDVSAENILHIHGEAGDPDSEIVLGHAWSAEERPLLYESVDPESADHRLLEAFSTLDDFFSCTFKPSKRIISDHLSFFDRLDAIEQVIVLGHSISPVDSAYFLRLIEAFDGRQVRWTIAMRPENDRGELMDNLKRMGVSHDLISRVLWSQC